MSQTNPLPLRRSKRKLAFIKEDNTVSDIPPQTIKKAKKVSAKKVKKVLAKKVKKVSAKDSSKTELRKAATLMSLNYDAQDKLLQYLDVKVRLLSVKKYHPHIVFFNHQSLEALSKTCSYFDQMINGRYLTTVNLPFGRFINDIKQSEILEKKPVLRLQCKDDLDMFVDTSLEIKQYLIETQLSLLDLSQVQEVDLVPVNI